MGCRAFTRYGWRERRRLGSEFESSSVVVDASSEKLI